MAALKANQLFINRVDTLPFIGETYRKRMEQHRDRILWVGQLLGLYMLANRERTVMYEKLLEWTTPPPNASPQAHGLTDVNEMDEIIDVLEIYYQDIFG